MSVVVGDARRHAPADLQGRPRTRCSPAARRSKSEGRLYPLDPVLIAELREEYDELSADGFRVLAIA